MSGRPQLSRQVPATSVSKFDDWCAREGHVNGGDKGRYAEQAIIEYLPPAYRPERFRDDLDELESDLRADLKEVGHQSEVSSLNETPTSRADDATVKLTYRIAEDVQDALQRYVYDQEDKVRGVIGEYVAAALDEYRDGGRIGRVRRYYEQLREHVDMISADRVGSVVEAFNAKYDDRDWCQIEEVRIVTEDALDVRSNDVRNDFVNRAIDRLGFVAVETGDGVYATPERAEEIVQQREVDTDLNYHLWDKDDRADYLRKAVKARSLQGSKAGVKYDQVREEIFEGEASIQYSYDLMELAGEHSEFEYGERNGSKMLRYTGEKGRVASEPVVEWVNDATELLQEFCDSLDVRPTELDQSHIDNRILRAKYPEEYDVVGGPPVEAMQSVTEDDRESVRNRLIDVSEHGETQTETETSEEMNRITKRADPVTDGGEGEL